MNHIIKIGLLASIVGIYACHSPNKKDIINKSINDTLKQLGSLQPDTQSKIVNKNLLNQPKLAKLVFPSFNVMLHNFEFVGDWGDNGKFIYSGNISNVKLNVNDSNIWIATSTNDTISLVTGADYNDNIEIIPRNGVDKFKLYYSFKVFINEFRGSNSALWEKMAPYTEISDSSKYFFKLSKLLNSSSFIKTTIKDLNLKDTTFKYDNGDYGEQTENGIIYNDKLCVINDDNCIYLKINRFNNNQLKDTKYLVIEYQDPD